ncbi:hypothetical protein [Actinocrispum wychmicini]|uniref:Uncharacterized protein n=1 Tax=Actinocrispum wychmicini TaxID=1213861 RepID=A0A4R2JHP1_9PSEU|nr:hypothetical protein [Actinocrispum wychmicini]TCO55909.1 hypothetical protein EV192_107332 [Actinocrispum wychmicini]
MVIASDVALGIGALALARQSEREGAYADLGPGHRFRDLDTYFLV